MTTYRGMDGYLAIGGYLVGSGSPAIQLNAGLGSGASSMTLKGGSGVLNGVVAVGDTFVLAGETGTPTHTVTGTSTYLAAGNLVSSVTFTPNTASTVAISSGVTFTSNVIVQMKGWDYDTNVEMLDATYVGLAWRNFVGGVAGWKMKGSALLDYGDLRQKAIIDELIAAVPAPAVNCVVLGVNQTGPKQWFSAAVAQNLAIKSQTGALVTVEFDLTGSGALATNWT
jgi:hypothetical protein